MAFIFCKKLFLATFLVAFSLYSKEQNDFDSYTNTGEVVLKSSTLSLYDEVLHGALADDGVLMRIDNVLVKHPNEIKTQTFDVVETVGGSKYFRVVNGTTQSFNFSAIKNLPGVIPTGSKLTNISFNQFASCFDDVFINSLGSKYANDLLQIKNGLDKGGNLTEGIISQAMREQGYTVIDDLGKYGSNNGYDVVAFKGTLDNPTEIIIIESKQFKYTNGVADDVVEHGGVTLNPPSSTTPLPAQMSDAWVQYVGSKLRAEGKTGIANMIRDFDDKITKYVSAVDKTQGEINFLKLGTY